MNFSVCSRLLEVLWRLKIFTILLILEMKFAFTNSVNPVPRRSTGDILDRLTKAEIIDDIIPRAPYEPLEVYYKNYTVDFGNELPAKALQEAPEVRWPAPNGTMYSLVVVGPDVPTREKPEERDWLHWLIGNIPRNDTAKGELRADYIGPERPTYHVGMHRLVFILYKHPDNLPCFFFGSVIKKRGEELDRAFFSPNLLCKEHNFKRPIAANYAMINFDQDGEDD